MSYYDPLENEKMWVNGWIDWLISKYAFTPARISVGLDDTDAHAYDIGEFSRWAKSKGLSTAYWMYNPSTPTSSDQSLKKIYDNYQ